MSSEIKNLILVTKDVHSEAFGVKFDYDSATGIVHVHGTLTDKERAQAIDSFQVSRLVAGEYVSLSLDTDLENTGVYVQVNSVSADNIHRWIVSLPGDGYTTKNTQQVPSDYSSSYCFIGVLAGRTVDVTFRMMLVEGTTPAAWAPAEGETLPGGGCSDER